MTPSMGAPEPISVPGRGRGVAVVIAPSAFGVTDDLRDQMRSLAADAAEVLTFDPFARTDPGPAGYAEMPRIFARLGALDRAATAADLRVAITRARAGSRRVVLVGICFGGPFALHAAADGAVDAAVMWHPSRLEQHLARASEVNVPMHLHFGAVDPITPPQTVDAVRAAFAGRPAIRVVVHDGATHGFSHPAAPAHDPAAEAAAIGSVRELCRALSAAG